jgi:hypothetical protein
MARSLWVLCVLCCCVLAPFALDVNGASETGTVASNTWAYSTINVTGLLSSSSVLTVFATTTDTEVGYFSLFLQVTDNPTLTSYKVADTNHGNPAAVSVLPCTLSGTTLWKVGLLNTGVSSHNYRISANLTSNSLTTSSANTYTYTAGAASSMLVTAGSASPVLVTVQVKVLLGSPLSAGKTSSPFAGLSLLPISTASCSVPSTPSVPFAAGQDTTTVTLSACSTEAVALVVMADPAITSDFIYSATMTTSTTCPTDSSSSSSSPTSSCAYCFLLIPLAIVLIGISLICCCVFLCIGPIVITYCYFTREGSYQWVEKGYRAVRIDMKERTYLSLPTISVSVAAPSKADMLDKAATKMVGVGGNKTSSSSSTKSHPKFGGKETLLPPGVDASWRAESSAAAAGGKVLGTMGKLPSKMKKNPLLGGITLPMGGDDGSAESDSSNESANDENENENENGSDKEEEKETDANGDENDNGNDNDNGNGNDDEKNAVNEATQPEATENT